MLAITGCLRGTPGEARLLVAASERIAAASGVCARLRVGHAVHRPLQPPV
jgi:hypothetical protein